MNKDSTSEKKKPLIPIEQIAAKIGISEDELEYYGQYKAKINREDNFNPEDRRGKLVMVTAMTPTPSG